MPEPDYYKLLGVSRNATAEEIRKAYKKIVRENHPDVKPDDKAAAQRFSSAQEAYDILGDEEKRKQYDQFGAAYFKGGGGPGPQGRNYRWSAGPGETVDFSDIFGQMDLGDLFGGAAGRGGFGGFGGQQPRQGPRKGEDQRSEVLVPFQVAAEGGTHELQLRRGDKLERLNVKVPAGVEQGSVIRLAGQGLPGAAGGPAGDLLITIQVAPHPYFRREGKNLLLDVPITPVEAALGAKVEVPTLSEGKVVLTVPAGASSGTKLRLRGKGVLDAKSQQRGDQLVVIKIVIPHPLSDRARELYEELAKAESANPRQGLW